MCNILSWVATGIRVLLGLENGIYKILRSLGDNEVSKTMKKLLMRFSKMVRDLFSR